MTDQNASQKNLFRATFTEVPLLSHWFQGMSQFHMFNSGTDGNNNPYISYDPLYMDFTPSTQLIQLLFNTPLNTIHNVFVYEMDQDGNDVAKWIFQLEIISISFPKFHYNETNNSSCNSVYESFTDKSERFVTISFQINSLAYNSLVNIS